MSSYIPETLKKVTDSYASCEHLLHAERYGSGHINETYRLTCRSWDGKPVQYILQSLSPAAFPNPQQVMENFAGITEHLRKKIEAAGGDPMRETLRLFRTKDGKDFYTAPDGSAWRLIPFIENTVCLQMATPELFEASARAFGRFQMLLADYPIETLHETIVGFHDSEKRFANFLEALQTDKMGRAKEIQPEIQFVLEREKDCSVLLDAHRKGDLPLRVTHNDTKLNNVLFDEMTMEGICVIDLDTTMPGLSVYDFGDSIRFGANHCAEDEKDLSKVNFDLDLYCRYTRGFLEGAQGTLTQKEKEYLPWGAKLMTLECGIRFLTDYLEGDHYFRIHYPEQNLDRCRTQFKLVADMEHCWDPMQQIVKDLDI